MTNNNRATTTFAALAVLLMAGCAHPIPGPNAAADAAQRPGDVPLAAPPTRGQELSAVAANQVVVTFPLGGTMLGPDQGRKLDLASQLFRDANPTLMFVTGHADPVGEDFTNLVLSARRAEMVKRALVARGIPSDRLLLQALGSSDPADTSDPSASSNRRVVITWRLL